MRTREVVVGLVTVAVLATGCSSNSTGTGASAGPTATKPPTGLTQPPGTGACDDTDPSACLLPWPNDRFTRADAASATGRRLDLPKAGMPANAQGVHIDPTEWNRNDGFSPSSILLTRVPDVDPHASGLPPVTDIGASLAPGSPLVLVDLTNGTRAAAWAELDANVGDRSKQMLQITPAASLIEGHRYAVGLSGLKRTDGTVIPPSPGFASMVAHPTADQASWLQALATHGAPKKGLYLAWAFTIGSTDNISGRLRHMWDETSKALGSGAPPFHVTNVAAQGGAKVVSGTFTMPRYLTGDGGPGTHLDNGADPNGLPVQNGSMTDAFLCTLPANPKPGHRAPTVLYGHGLLGSRTEVLGIGKLAAGAGIGMCAVDWLGMSEADIGAVVSSFQDLTRFRTVPDRLQQGEIGFLELGRLLRSDKGFVTDPAFRVHGKPAIDTSQVSFLGASQGGVLGAAPSAVTHDWTRVILAVPGIGYNLLLRRSVDFDKFKPSVDQSYPDLGQRPLVLDLLEQLWQRGENAGYAEHLTAQPFPGTPAKTVLLLEAFGDHQVANVSTEKLARTLGIGRRVPTLADGRSTDRVPFFDIPALTLPTTGSGLVVWDFDTPAPPITNTPNRAGSDPHGKLADVPEALALVLSFIPTDGHIIDVCGKRPCHTPG